MSRVPFLLRSLPRPRFRGGLAWSLVLTAALLGGGCSGGDEASAAAAAPEAAERVARVRAVDLEPHPVQEVVRLPADLRPARRATLASEVAGTLDALAVDAGDRVRAGQTLARVDRRALDQAVAEAEAVFRQRDKQLERARNLFAKQSITQAQMLDAVTNHDVAEAALASARLQLAKATIGAPWAGTVSRRLAEVGDYLQPGQAVIELVQIDPLEVVVPVPAGDSAALAPGGVVWVEIDAFPGERFQARVARVAPEADPATRTVALEAELANPEGRIRPGMPARLELVKRERPAALTVPAAAVVELEGDRAVYVVADGRAELRPVTLGPVVGTEIVVEEGLAAGDRVVVDGVQRVSGGQRVEATVEPAADATVEPTVEAAP